MRRRALLGVLLASPAAAAPSSQRWPLWERSDEGSRATVDQGPWARFLRAHVRPGADGINRVAYTAAAGERAALEADLGRLAAVPVSALRRAEQRAYWANLYNELTVLTVLRHMPVASITKINLGGGGLFGGGPWDAKLVQVEGTALSLNDIEHRILRPIWRDPRTHYAVNCASLGCPNLPTAPFAASAMDTQLERAAAEYVNHPRGATVRNGRLTASRIYDWYQADFGGNEAGVVAHLRQHARPELAEALAGVPGVAGYAYDWALNGA